MNLTGLLVVAIVAPLVLVGILVGFNRAFPFAFRYRFAVFLACGILQVLVLVMNVYRGRVWGLTFWLSIVGALVYFSLAFHERADKPAT